MCPNFGTPKNLGTNGKFIILDVPILKHNTVNTFLNSMSLYFALKTVETNTNSKSIKFQEDMFDFCDFIQVVVFISKHHLNMC